MTPFREYPWAWVNSLHLGPQPGPRPHSHNSAEPASCEVPGGHRGCVTPAVAKTLTQRDACLLYGSAITVLEHSMTSERRPCVLSLHQAQPTMWSALPLALGLQR